MTASPRVPSERAAASAAPGDSARSLRRPGRTTVLWWVGFAVALLLPAALIVLRHTYASLQADGVWQSVMSVQDVDVFYWSQDRFAAVLPLLASPIADPGVNLFALLLINALAFQGALLLLAHMGVGALTARPGRLATLTTYLVLTATAQLVLTSFSLYVVAIEASPHSTAWLLAIGSFELWKRSTWWAWAAAVPMAFVSAGLSAQALLISGFLVIIQIYRTRQWRPNLAYLAVWLLALVGWMVLAKVAVGPQGPLPMVVPEYFRFSLGQLREGAEASAQSVLSAFRAAPMVSLVVLAGLSLLFAPGCWSDLVPRLALTVAFAGAFWLTFTANSWVAANQYQSRYFWPVVVAPVLCIGAGLAVGLLRIMERPAANATPHAWAGPLRQVAPPLVAASVVLLALTSGPLRLPKDSIALASTAATATWIRDNDVTFISGYYWDMWPILQQSLTEGRDSHFVAASKSGGDPQAYREALNRDLARDGLSRAACVNDEITVCQQYLDYWTAPGWQPTDVTCPVPPVEQVLGSPPAPGCRVLEFRP